MQKLFVLLIVLIGASKIWVHDVKIKLEKVAFQSMKFSLQNSVHDASLFVVPNSVTSGKIVFDQIKAKQNFLDSMGHNIGLKQNMTLENNVLYTKPLTIVEEKYIDYNWIDPSTGSLVKFPYTYNRVLPNGQLFSRVIFGPSVVFIVKTRVIGTTEDHEFITIQEYKG
ncbi:hypothetical protein [Gottfriedia solisilvae]|uniref:hypothetical protein n=1 Tax=Gottfriedia solisilvae TaxID=1516104 RepID=UPI003D2EE5A6